MPEQQKLEPEAPKEKVSEELEAARKELEEKKVEFAKMKLERDQEKFVRTREQNELATFRQQKQQFEQQQYQNQEPLDDVGQLRQQLQQLEAKLGSQNDQIGLMAFKTDNPNADATKILEIINDPNIGQNLIAYDQAGQLNYRATFQAADNYLARQELEQVRQKTTAAAGQTAADVERQKLNATISGSAASEAEPPVDLTGMSSNEMLEKGYVEQDLRDPIKPRGS